MSVRSLTHPIYLLTAVAACGCGGFGGLSQEDMKKYAIRRPSDDDDRPKPPAAAPAKNAKPADSTPSTAPPPDSNQRSPPVAPEVPLPPAPPVALPKDRPADVARPAIVGGDLAGAEIEMRAPGPPPDAPTTPSERLALSRDNLSRIGAALNRYVAEQKAFPTPAIYNGRQTPLLSWRVALLPYLGNWELYLEFDRDEPWDSPHNQTLISRIPEVYQSPERWDASTNYMAVTGRVTLFPGGRPVVPRRLEDGRSNTLAIVEVDDELAVPWTKPQDYSVTAGQPLNHLGKLRDGVFLSVFADGQVHAIPAAATAERLWAALTFDGGEEFAVADLLELSEPPVDAPTLPAPTAVQPAAADFSKKSPAAKTSRSMTASHQAPISRLTMPAQEARLEATRLVKELYREKFLAATQGAKAQLAREMADAAQSVAPAERYVLLDTAREVAIVAGDVELTIELIDEFVAAFTVDEVELRAESAEKLARAVTEQNVEDFVNWSAKHGRSAMKAERYKEGEQLVSAAVSRAYRYGDQQLKERMRKLRETIDYGREMRHASEQALLALEKNSADGVAATTLGKYLCFVKDDWENGLPILSSSSAPALKKVADYELETPKEATERLKLADMWWDQAQRQEGPERDAMLKRAVLWYRQSLDGLPPGLLTIRAERRVEEFEEEFPEEDL